ncbi:Hypothetical protein LUCI_5141 [Lucifera butyrica]|uniref:DUF1015 domain-containing protein n=1 Tax=Lucifera butyrica TaxID=1351585 RepID=A0A498RIB4_9FIRM|nr:DUF1015 family protein [Lucifera butyrica]VBB09843.1 Hypothetical protein LUCI_5141 [Lucifera butyrica]
MATVKPFRGFRPVPALAAQVASLPYDVMDSAEARLITSQNPLSFLRVTKAEVDLPPDVDIHSAVVYQKARENWEWLIQEKIMVQDEQPSFYIYRQQMEDHVQVGLVAAVSVDEYEQGIIKKHELTRPDKEQDRVDHILTTGVQTGPAFLTYKEDAVITGLMQAAMETAPVCDFTADDGIRHTLYAVAAPSATAALAEAFEHIPVLYIADGHHRSAAALKVRDVLRRGNPVHTGAEAYNYFLAVIFPHTMMKIMDYNRVVRDLNGLTHAAFFERLEACFTYERQQGPVKPESAKTFGMYLASRWYELAVKPEVVTGLGPVAGLDVSILQDHLLQPVLDIGDPRTDQRIHFVGGIRGMGELERLVDSGDYQVAFSLFPTAIEELMAIADLGGIMPPKSTWFEPKLRDAMVVHVIR